MDKLIVTVTTNINRVTPRPGSYLARSLRWIVLAACTTITPLAFGWNSAGHQTVGAIADTLIAGSNAATQVRAILGTEKLATAALWADCAKGVVSDQDGFHFVVSSRFPECAPFQTAEGKQAMVEFAQRNWDACQPAADEETCHRQYHYADVAIERDGYARTEVGTSDHDIVSAMNAAIAVLRGNDSAAPISLTSKREALRVLAHYIGDLHQPLHVGAIYLDAAGHEVDPDQSGLDPGTKNRGGNLLMDGSKKLHALWDAIPAKLTVARFKTEGVRLARRVPKTPGLIEHWSEAWASETVIASHRAFRGVSFGAEDLAHTTWPVTEPAGYGTARAKLQKAQLVKAGARFAQLLKAIFP